MRVARRPAHDSPVCLSDSLLAAAEIGVLEFTGTATLRRASPLASRWLGIPRAATFPRGEPPLERGLVECVTEASRRDGTVATAAVTGRSGEPLLITAKHFRGRNGQSRVTCLVRRAASGAAPQSASRDVELLGTMVEASQDGLWILTGSGVILHLNSRAAQLNGITTREVIGRNTEELLRAGYFDRSIALEVISRRVGVTLVQTLQDGRKLLVSGKPIFSPDGGLQYVVITERDITEMNRLLARLQETTKLSERYRTELRTKEMHEVHAGRIVARSEPMRAVWEMAMRYAAVDSPVLLLGETGTGKGVFAKLIHQASARSAGPFLEVNCGAIPEGLIEAELFGYAKGAFTGADARGKAGLVELAHTGTLLLNEIGDFPVALQVKLLRFLEDGEIHPIGAVRGKRPDVRILAATNRDLTSMIAQGAFRQDLFYRLNVLTIHIPPLRERRQDIPWLVDMMLSQVQRKLGKRRSITPAALDLISRYPFPGNVRELWNLIERLVIATDTETIDVRDLPLEVSQGATFPAGTLPGRGGTLQQALRSVEAAMLKDALARCGTQVLAARHLGVGQATIARKVKRYGLK